MKNKFIYYNLINYFYNINSMLCDPNAINHSLVPLTNIITINRNIFQTYIFGGINDECITKEIFELMDNVFTDLCEIYNYNLKNDNKTIKKVSQTNKIKNIIILKGGSSVGKTSCSIEFQKLMYRTGTIFAIYSNEDHFLFGILNKDYLVDGLKSNEGFSVKRDENFNIINFSATKDVWDLYLLYSNILDSYLANFDNIIIEGNFIGKENIELLIEKINNISKKSDFKTNICIFTLEAKLAVLEKREQDRKDRAGGFAQLHFNSQSKENDIYDYKNNIINTDEKNTNEIAEFICQNYKNKLFEI
jgi:chloramphenicol 3-O-phosphotransferase